MRIGGWRAAIAAALALPGVTAPGAAQIVRALDEVRACLCKEESVSALNGEVQAQSRAYEEKRQTFEALDKQVQSTRPQVNVKSQADIDAFKQLLERRDEAADTLAGPATRSYTDAVRRYNEAVTDYNSACAGKSFDPDQLAQEKRTLACAKP